MKRLNTYDRILLKIWTRFALNNFATGRYEKAERYFEKLSDRFPEKPGVKYNLALAKAGLGKRKEAEDLIRNEILAHGDQFVYRKSLAEIYYNQGKYDDALGEYKACGTWSAKEDDRALFKLRREYLSNPAKHAELSASRQRYLEGCVLQGKDPAGAFAAFQTAYDLDGSNFLALNNMGVLCMNVFKDYEAAKKYFTMSLGLSSQPLVKQNLDTLKSLKQNLQEEKK